MPRPQNEKIKPNLNSGHGVIINYDIMLRSSNGIGELSNRRRDVHIEVPET